LTPREYADAAVRTLGVVAALVAVVVLWDFGTLSPCGVLREAARQRDSLASVLPDNIVDLGLEGQYGPLSDGRCLAVLMKNLSTPILSTAQTTRLQIMPPFPHPAPTPPVRIRETKQRHE
jgi:hypothetical protein